MHSERKNLYKDISWQVGDIPFVFRFNDSPTNAEWGLPDRMKFTLEVDKNTGRMRQSFDENVLAVLERAYGIGSTLSGAMNASGIGKNYAVDFLTYIDSSIPDLTCKRVLEIGCGTGYLLSLLKERGAEVIGIEPGPQGITAEGNYGVKVIRDFFPSRDLMGTFDLIIAYGVLEHIAEPEQFLVDIEKYLSPNGLVILAVPNCAPYIEAGDLSCLIHEHWSYFTVDSLQALVEQHGFQANVVNAGFGGSLYCCARRLAGRENRAAQKDALPPFMKFQERSGQMVHKLGEILTQAAGNKKEVGIYVAGRMLNALALLTSEIKTDKLRFFDDNEALHRGYFPSFANSIENWEDFIVQPPDIVLIASNTFGKKIRERIERTSKTKVVDWYTLFDM